MTKEELREEATSTVEWEYVSMIDRPLFVWAYITGAEPREERIAELEKENEKLKEEQSFLSNLVKEKERRGFEIQEDLLKENAKLKSIVDFQTSSNMGRYFQLKRSKEKLTKAKEIIKKLVEAIHTWDFKNLEQVETEAEQFLNEVEK